MTESDFTRGIKDIEVSSTGRELKNAIVNMLYAINNDESLFLASMIDGYTASDLVTWETMLALFDGEANTEVFDTELTRDSKKAAAGIALEKAFGNCTKMNSDLSSIQQHYWNVTA